MNSMMGMSSASMPQPIRWLAQPVMLHSDRTYKCKLNAAQCKYQQGYWRFWYEADHRYALPTVAFFCTAIALFSLAYIVTFFLPRRARQARPVRRLYALGRYLSYRSFRAGPLSWSSAPLGVLLLGLVGTVFFMAMSLGPRPYYWPNTHKLSFGDSPPLATRTGWMSLACLPFIFATAGKSNLVTLFTGISHEKLQVFHRWISYACFVLALLHTFPFIVYHMWKGDMVYQWNTSVFYWTGVAALVAQAWLTFASFSSLRTLCYEFFKFSHFLAALVFMLTFFFHCNFRMSSWDYFIATAVIFCLGWFHSNLRTFFEHGIGRKATISMASSGFVQVTVPCTSPWTAGQHYFVRFLSPQLQPLTSHPFTACSLPTALNDAKDSELTFFIRPHTGFTTKLASYAKAHPGASLKVLINGPYGGVHMTKLTQSNRLLLIAGGSGAGWMLPLVECYLRRVRIGASEPPTTDKAEPVRSLQIVLATREMETRRWFEQTVSDMLTAYSLDKESARVAVQTYYTGSSRKANMPQLTGTSSHGSSDLEKAAEATVAVDSHSDAETSSQDTRMRVDGQSSLAGEFLARPELPEIVSAEAVAAGSDPLGVFVCGPCGMQSDVANAVAAQQLRIMREGAGDVYLHMEHFSWA